MMPRAVLIASLAVSSALLLLAGTASAIYDDDHWSYSKELTESTFSDVIQKEIDAGKTMFVRWIASPG